MIDCTELETRVVSRTMRPRSETDDVLPIIHERQSLVIDTPNTDFCKDFVVAGTRVASCAMSKAAADVDGSTSVCFVQQANINAVQLHPESIHIISHETRQASMATRQAAQATDIPEHEMIDMSAFERSQLLIADSDLMTNNVSHQNTSLVPQPASMVTHLTSMAT